MYKLLLNIFVCYLFALVFTSCEDEAPVHQPISYAAIQKDSIDITDPKYDGKTIYELGDSITDYSTNFENLFRYFDAVMSNADEFELIDASYVETISDSATFRKYRNFFSRLDQQNGNMLVSSSRGTSQKTEMNIQLTLDSRHQTRLMYFKRLPNYDSIFTTDYQQKIDNISKGSFNIDSISDLRHHTSDKLERKITVTHEIPRSTNTSTNGETVSVYTSGDLSQSYIDLNINHTKKFDDLDNSEKRKVIYEDVLSDRITRQLFFNQHVDIGDTVYKIKYKYRGDELVSLAFCDKTTKKVKADQIFSIKIKNRPRTLETSGN